jgi:ABC-type transporter Mla subunit MlaD
MTPPKVPGPKDVKAAAQFAAETAQGAVSDAVRGSRASLELVGQLPDLIENLVAATERLNAAIDRAERYLALADPMIRTMDAVLPQLEALVDTGNDVFNAVSTMPGASTLGRLTGRGTAGVPRDAPARGRSAPKKPR